eukprot:TRINITY_DN1093_c0_g1_i1.p1 TRINITY_DN1093_c0_g1~~TRINITY_DN1093_c0_g1_i1.p1  ORF type:complete len:184 (-),score=51.19 TRINITY_DN1093_c0_g1_i1:82-633(-)
MLRRGIERVVVFVDTSTPLSLDLKRGAPLQLGQIDMFLPGLFGLEFEGMDGQYWLNKGCDVSHNLVFADGENQFWDMVQQLQHKKRSGVAVTAQSHLHVLPNEFWGLEGGTQVEVCWVYLEAVPEWHQHLPQDVRDLLSDPDEDLFQNFPHYSTCLLYTSDAADEEDSVDLGGRRIIKKKKKE